MVLAIEQRLYFVLEGKFVASLLQATVELLVHFVVDSPDVQHAPIVDFDDISLQYLFDPPEMQVVQADNVSISVLKYLE